jgi:nucleotide-binding universal stress UspA family protein
MISKILLATDGSRTASKAAAYATDLAKQLNASLVVVSVVTPALTVRTVPLFTSEPSIAESSTDFLEEAAEEFVSEVEELCTSKGVLCEKAVPMGSPLEEIPKEAARSQADLIIVGSHGRGDKDMTVLGRVAHGLLRSDIDVPIMIVKD